MQNSIDNMKILKEYYDHYGARLKVVEIEGERLSFPTDMKINTVKDCNLSENKIGDCGYDGVGNMLKYLIKDGGMIKEPEMNWEAYGKLSAFSQKPFIIDTKTSDLDDLGLLYVPTACNKASTGCKLHVAIHGTEQSMFNELNVKYQRTGYKLVMDHSSFATNTGYLQYAASNNIVVLFP